MAIQADGKIVVGRLRLPTAPTRDFALARYNADGSLDTTFDGDGKVTTDFDGPATTMAYGVAVQADGKIVVAGLLPNGTGDVSDFALARYNADGSLDTTFDGDGKVTTDFGGGHDDGHRRGAPGRRQDRRGRAAAVGGVANDFALARYNADGSLDTTFDGDGKVTTDFGRDVDAASGVAVQADGKIVVAGSCLIGCNDDFALARYNADGSLDTTFDGDGKVTTAFGGASDDAVGVGDPGRRQDRRRRERRRTRPSTTSRWPATTPTAAWTPPSTATAR